MRFAVHGAGAIGGLVAARLAQHGGDVVLVCRTTAQADAITRDGLRLRTPEGSTLLEVTATTGPVAGVDVAFIAVKAFALQPLLDSRSLADASSVVPLLNGLDHPAALRQALPGVDVRVAAIYVQATRTAATVFEQQSSAARITLGPAARHAGSDPLRAVLAAAGFGVDIADEQRVLWDKFARVCWAATLCSVNRTPVGAAREALQGEAEAFVAELAEVATAGGAPTRAGELHAALWALPPELAPSMLRDVEAGGLSEVDAITGAFIRRARSLAIPVPTAEKLYTQLRQPASAAETHRSGGPPA